MNEKKIIHLDVVEVDGTRITSHVACTDLGGGLFRVDEIPYSIESLNFGDVFEGELNGELVHVRNVVRKSGWRTQYFLIRKENRSAPWLVKICEKTSALGGLWGWFCGMLVISLPGHETYDPTDDIQSGRIPNAR